MPVMTKSVTAPPRPSPNGSFTAHDPGEVLIKEAKRRARRRRWIYGGTAAVVVAIVAGLSILPSSPSPPQGASRNVPTPPTPPTPLGAPLVEGRDAASTLLTSWYWGSNYVAVYADGRVIWDTGRGVSQYERFLTPHGLELVRAGKFVDPTFLSQTRLIFRMDLWGELPSANLGAATVWPRTYEPSQYAICAGTPGESVPATKALGLLPEPAQALLKGKQRTYDPAIGIAPRYAPLAPWPVAQRPPIECFEVTPAERDTFWQIIDASDIPRLELFHLPTHALVTNDFILSESVIYPHGQPVF